jgi:hypothetical protein
MLRRLLDHLRSGETTSQTNLAQKMGIDVAILDQLIRQLVQLGYLEMVSSNCDTGAACTGCEMGAVSCARPFKMWHLTEKGKNAAG